MASLGDTIRERDETSVESAIRGTASLPMLGATAGRKAISILNWAARNFSMAGKEKQDAELHREPGNVPVV
jgi:hypothetical protein